MLAGGDPPAPGEVIDGDHAAWRHLWQQGVEVGRVFRLDRIDEGELNPRREAGQDAQRRFIDDADPVGDPGAQPVAAGPGPPRAAPGGAGASAPAPAPRPPPPRAATPRTVALLPPP